MIAGAALALAVPLAAIVLAGLVERGIVAFGPVHDAFDVLGGLLWLGLGVLGPVGIAIFGRSARARGLAEWLAVAFVGVLIVLPVWVAGAVALSGAMGNPF